MGDPNAGGAEVVTFQHASAWVKAGHKVTLFTSRYKGGKEVDEIGGVRIIRRGGQAFGVKIRAFFWYVFQSEKFDLVVDEFHGLPFFTPLYAKGKVLGFIHEVSKEVWRLNPWPRPFDLIPAIIGTFGEPFIFRLIYKNTKFMTVSESTKKDLQNWGIRSELIRIIHNGVIIPKHLRKYKKESRRTVIYLGGLAKDKGIEDALVVFCDLERKFLDYQFWIVGKGEKSYERWLKKRTLELGLKRSVRFFGYVDESKKFELLSRADVLINPSVREGWGLVVIEAASVGTPTVAYRVAGLQDSIKDGVTGRLATSRDPKVLANLTLELLKNDAEYQSMVVECRKWAKKFDWTKSTKESLKYIESV